MTFTAQLLLMGGRSFGSSQAYFLGKFLTFIPIVVLGVFEVSFVTNLQVSLAG